MRGAFVSGVITRCGVLLACSATVLGLSGCYALPYLDTAQGAYRVDPVLVQWGSRRTATATPSDRPGEQAPVAGAPAYNACPTSPDSNNNNTRTPADVMCPLDLDTYVFPQDLKLRPSQRRTAYERVLTCQVSIAPAEFGVSLGHKIDEAKAREVELRQLAASLPVSIQTEQALLDTRKATQKQFEGELAKAKTAWDTALASANAATADKKPALQEAADKLKADYDGIAQKKADADKQVDAQAKKVDELKADLKNLQDQKTANDNVLKSLQKEVQAFGGDREALGGSATLAESLQEAYCVTLRNQLQEEIITRSTPMCNRHLSDIEATASLFNATFGFGALTQSALASVVTGKALAQALSTGATITTGSQAVINKEIYRNTVVPAIKRAIRADRERRLNTMRANQLRPLMEYQAARAVGEAAAYHDACSFSNGLELIGNDAEKRVEPSIPEIEARVKALMDQIKTNEASITGSSTEAEKRLVARSKLRLRQEIDILQSRITAARQGGSN